MIRREDIPRGILENMERIFEDSMDGFVLPDLFFSDDKPPRKTYGDLGEKEIAEIIAMMKYNYEKRSEEVREEASFLLDRLNRPGAEEWLFQVAGSEDMPEEWLPLIRKVRDLYARKKTVLTIDGMYYPKDNHIVIYEKAFENAAPFRKEAAIRRVIAHELFHAFHHFAAAKTFGNDSYEALVVREALADFYSYVLCLDLDSAHTDCVSMTDSTSVARDRYGFWRKELFGSIPYPNAIFFMYRDGYIEYDSNFDECWENGPIDKMRLILDISRTDMHEAYLELVPEAYRKRPPQERPTLFTVVSVSFGDYPGAKLYSYLLDPNDAQDVRVGETVACGSRTSLAAVEKVQIMDSIEYDEECLRVGYPKLSIARRLE